ncbi:urokinase plasminogen activator surface receptor-like [Onychostoma macrolepis]|uniref:Sodefrin-like factor n=1 Tax=Onychostoma macrolepis TaxID=369639 RepID=A0A7J6DF73_9TELE|nr:urokinase plasminogen activator surface receptor-like [Onychostoma macrolepis]KAF4117983.1 hypothetical protein G5714_000034 [Onychostoma macrolepis]
MDLQTSRALLLFILFTAGTQISSACNTTERKFGSAWDSQWCYECKGLGNYCPDRPVICPIGFSKCMSSTFILQIGDTPVKMKQKECIEECQDSSINYGTFKQTFSCCDTRLCNYRDAPDPRTNVPNGRTCYYCDGQDCSKTVRCSGTEDRCITTTMTKGGLKMLVKGCISKYMCGALKCSFIQDVSCCEGDLCNGDKSITQAVTQSFRNNADESVNQSVTRSILQSFMHGAKSVTKRLAYNDAKSVTDSMMYNHAKRVRQKVMYNDAKSVNQRVVYNNAKSVKQSFLFLCCSLLSYFLRL